MILQVKSADGPIWCIPGEEVIAQENNYQGMPYVRRQIVLLWSDQRSFRCPDRWKCLWQGRRFGPEGSCFLP